MPKILSLNFLLLAQFWKGQVVIRQGPSRTIFRLFLDLPINSNHLFSLALSDNPIEVNEISATLIPCPDLIALDRGKLNENTDYLAPKEGSFWNDSKDTPSWVERLDSGSSLILIDSPIFKKFSFSGKKLKGIFTITQDSKDSNLWLWKRSAGPGGAR